MSCWIPFTLMDISEFMVPIYNPILQKCITTLFFNFFFIKYNLLIMLLQLSPFFPLPHYVQYPSSLQQFTPFSSCPWVIHISSLPPPFPILLTSLCLFCTYQLFFVFPYLFPHSLPSPSPVITLHVISIPIILFLCRCLLSLFIYLGSVVDSCEIVLILLLIVLIFFFLDKSP